MTTAVTLNKNALRQYTNAKATSKNLCINKFQLKLLIN